MSGDAESASGSPRGIRRVLVRYGRSGRVGWFGTVHDTPLARSDAVVVLTPLGEWPGVVLRTHAAPESEPPPLSGELLRRLNDDDRAAVRRSREKVRQLLERARAKLKGPEINRAASPTTAEDSTSILGGDTSLCGRFGIIEYAGRGGAALGPVAVQLADALGLERVQWIDAMSVDRTPADPTDAAHVSDDAGGDEAGGGASAGGSRTVGRPLGAGMGLPGRAPHPDALDTAEALRSTDALQVSRHARRRRERLGMMGAYLQKIRDDGPGRNDGPGVPGTQHPGQGQAVREGPKRRWMVRVRATAGGIMVGQLEQLADLAVRYGDGSLRLTMRQGLQMHGIVVGSAAEVIREAEGLAMTTRGSCGNVLRNVTCCPLRPRTAAAATARQLAVAIARDWLPRAEWLSAVVEPAEAMGDRWTGDIERDTAYPDGYLPHKWKVGVATAEDNCIDVLTGDIGLVVHQKDGTAAFIDCYVGGSLAYRPAVVGSEAMLAEPLGRVALADIESVLQGLAGLHRELVGERSRHWRRLKYLVRRLGARELVGMLEGRAGRRGMFSSIPAAGLPQWNEHPRWMRQGDGSWTRVVAVAGGRLRFGAEDPGENWLRLCRLGESLRIGPRHSLVIEGIAASRRQEVDSLLAGPLRQATDGEADGDIFGDVFGDIRGTMRVLTCVALPTCPLAVAEAERDLPVWRRAIESVADDAALIATEPGASRLTVAVSGCSNGCSHPLTAAIGVVAESPRRFRVFVGGNGCRLGSSLSTIAGPAELAALVTDVAEQFRTEQEEGESFSEWWQRRQSEAR